jgi:hypothetical protein
MWVVVLAVLGLPVAGCGGGGGNSGATQAGSTPAKTEPAASTAATETTTEPTTTTTPTAAAKASPDSTDRPDTNDDGSPDVQTFRGKPGDSFTLVGQPGYKKPSKEAVRVTVLSVTGPFTGYNLDPGRKLIGIKVRFEGVGTKVYDDPQPNGQLTVTGGETGKQTSLITGSGKNPCDNPSLKLTKGKKVSSCLAFEIPEKAKPQVFQYGASSGYGDTGIWKF